MNNTQISFSEAYYNLDIVIGMLKNLNVNTDLILSVELGKNAILAIELMGMSSKKTV